MFEDTATSIFPSTRQDLTSASYMCKTVCEIESGEGHSRHFAGNKY